VQRGSLASFPATREKHGKKSFRGCSRRKNLARPITCAPLSAIYRRGGRETAGKRYCYRREALDIGEIQGDIDRSAVIALAAVRGGLHLAGDRCRPACTLPWQASVPHTVSMRSLSVATFGEAAHKGGDIEIW
jgi:hypothetical protein